MLDQRERDWLRALLVRAVGCSLASSLALPGCGEALEQRAAPQAMRPTGVRGPGASGVGGVGGIAGAAGSTATQAGASAAGPQAPCVDGAWLLAPHFTLVREVDYLADRLGSLAIVSEVGAPCATATVVGACESSLAAPAAGLGRHLITSEGDEVRAWSADDAPVLFGSVDVAEEAIWLALAQGYAVVCDARIVESSLSGGFFMIDGDRAATGTCAPPEARDHVTVRVDHTGSTTETVTSAAQFACEGRRPEGLRSQHRPSTRALLGEHFAAMAHMEAASVPAFAAIAQELSCHGAPLRLVRAARLALRDEVRHARIAGALARRLGATPTPALVTPMPPRSLAAFALDNAIEGCVHETYAAARVRFQAARAADPVVRRALAAIAGDETRHAALSWEIGRWVGPKLPPTTRARIHAAQQQAVAALAAQLEATTDCAELQVGAGLPDAHAARVLHDGLTRTLWSA